MRGLFFKTLVVLTVILTTIPITQIHASSGSFNIMDYSVDYEIENGELITMNLDDAFSTLSVEIVSVDDGFIELTVPRGLLDSKFTETEDDIFFIIIDGLESHYLEIESTENYRTLIIPFFVGDEQVEIFGTDVLSSPPVKTSADIIDDPVPIQDPVDNEEPVNNEKDSTDNENIIENKGGGCLIATAAYGSELAPQVQQLRELRDFRLLQTESGSSFIESFNAFYYSFSPYIADYERENPAFKEVVKLFISPMIVSLSILNYVSMDSEIEVLGYGISLIILNLGMYVGIPAFTIINIRKGF